MKKQKRRKRSDVITDGSIDAGLLVLSSVAREGQTYSHRDLAFVCGCSWQMIYHVEKRALKKIRNLLRKEFKMSFGEFAQDTTQSFYDRV